MGEPPDSAEAVWQAAWQGFATRLQVQQPVGADAPPPGNAAATAGPAARADPPLGQQGEEQGAGEQLAGPLSPEAAALQRTPLLLLQVGMCAV